MKRCAVSGLVVEPQRIWVLDGTNNDGFSGGPVVVHTGTEQRVMAVVSGYRYEPVEVIPVPTSAADKPAEAQAHPKEMVNVNSGFIFAYDIEYAIDAIKKNPIGPLRPSK